MPVPKTEPPAEKPVLVYPPTVVFALTTKSSPHTNSTLPAIAFSVTLESSSGAFTFVTLSPSVIFTLLLSSSGAEITVCACPCSVISVGAETAVVSMRVFVSVISLCPGWWVSVSLGPQMSSPHLSPPANAAPPVVIALSPTTKAAVFPRKSVIACFIKIPLYSVADVLTGGSVMCSVLDEHNILNGCNHQTCL